MPPKELVDLFNIQVEFEDGTVKRLDDIQAVNLDEVIEACEQYDFVRVTRCRDCRYYQKNVWAEFGGVPIIAGHHLCSFWGDGCATSPDGFCFMGEKDGEDRGLNS